MLYRCAYIGNDLFISAISCTGVDAVSVQSVKEAEESCERMFKLEDKDAYGLIIVEDQLWSDFSAENRSRFLASVIPVVVPVSKGVWG